MLYDSKLIGIGEIKKHYPDIVCADHQLTRSIDVLQNDSNSYLTYTNDPKNKIQYTDQEVSLNKFIISSSTPEDKLPIVSSLQVPVHNMIYHSNHESELEILSQIEELVKNLGYRDLEDVVLKYSNQLIIY